jgi:ABC-type transport system involved in cytochrome c biogenesis permease subunit
MLIVIRVFYIVAFVLYALAAGAYLRDFRSSGTGGDVRRTRLWTIRLGVLLHFVGLAACAFYLRQAPFMGILQGFGFASWILAMMFLHISHSFEDETSVGMVIMPLAALFAIPGLFATLAKVTDPLLSSNPWFILHACIALYGYGAFTIAFTGAALYLILHREIKSKRLGTVFQRLPSLDQLDYMTYMSVTLGFVALTVSIITGMVWTMLRLGKLLQFDIKEVITFANWLIYAFYLHSRYSGRWRGRCAAWLVILGFAVVLFNFLVVTVLLSSTHAYI